MGFNANLDKVDILYQMMCARCPNAVDCHESCIECDVFFERLEKLENESVH